MFNDFALLKLAAPFTNLATFICFPGNDSNQFVGASLTASGWGVTNYQDNTFSEVLKSVDLVVIGNPECSGAFNLPMNPDQFCANDPAGTSSVCSGDSGGKW